MTQSEIVKAQGDSITFTLAKEKKKPGPLKEWTEEVVEYLSNELILWCQLPDSLVLAEFYGNNGFGYERAIEFDTTSPKWKEARRHAKAVIGARREKMGLMGKLDSPIVRATLGSFDPEHREYQKAMKASIDLTQGDKSISISLTQFSDPDQS